MGNIDYLIANLEKLDITGQNVVDIAGGKTRVVPYHELNNYGSIQQLLHPFGSVVILFETSQNVGHFTCLYFDAQERLHFFDPYGMSPDEDLHYARYDDTPYLSLLLKKYPAPLVMNQTRYQTWAEDINTCGRWAGLRIRTKALFDPQGFEELFGTKDLRNSPDWYVSAL